ncbi:type I-E CRISPR-associated protein Cas5/CasD [Siccibacter turicensis]
MSRYLVFQLYGPMASWGEPAVGETRHSSALPGRGALLGLLGAALGIRRDDDAALSAFNAGYQFILCAGGKPAWARDYHTVQVPRAARNHRDFTRREELRDPLRVETIISRRDYYSDGYWLVAVVALPGAPYPLEAIQAALTSPVFTLWLGRKSHPMGLPLCPQLFSGQANEAMLAAQAFYRQKLTQLGGRLSALGQFQPRCWWEGEHDGLVEDEVSIRRDSPLSRRRWQFGPRMGKQGVLKEQATCTCQK